MFSRAPAGIADQCVYPKANSIDFRCSNSRLYDLSCASLRLVEYRMALCSASSRLTVAKNTEMVAKKTWRFWKGQAEVPAIGTSRNTSASSAAHPRNTIQRRSDALLAKNICRSVRTTDELPSHVSFRYANIPATGGNAHATESEAFCSCSMTQALNCQRTSSASPSMVGASKIAGLSMPRLLLPIRGRVVAEPGIWRQRRQERGRHARFLHPANAPRGAPRVPRFIKWKHRSIERAVRSAATHGGLPVGIAFPASPPCVAQQSLHGRFANDSDYCTMILPFINAKCPGNEQKNA